MLSSEKASRLLGSMPRLVIALWKHQMKFFGIGFSCKKCMEFIYRLSLLSTQLLRCPVLPDVTVITTVPM